MFDHLSRSYVCKLTSAKKSFRLFIKDGHKVLNQHKVVTIDMKQVASFFIKRNIVVKGGSLVIPLLFGNAD